MDMILPAPWIATVYGGGSYGTGQYSATSTQGPATENAGSPSFGNNGGTPAITYSPTPHSPPPHAGYSSGFGWWVWLAGLIVVVLVVGWILRSRRKNKINKSTPAIFPPAIST